MARVHFLNVRDGDCSVIQHNSGHVSVIDVCNAATLPASARSASTSQHAISRSGVLGNFNQKQYPVNPIRYLQDHGISGIFRYIQTHPDMDHMDGLRAIVESYGPINFWDTDNNKDLKDGDWLGSPYRKEDWDLYKSIRDGKPDNDPKRLVNLSGSRGQYWNVSGDGSSGGDGIQILAPTSALVSEANDTGDYNRCSYVLLYRTGGHSIVFGGDSHDATWEYILENHESDVANVDLLIAPHHGRGSGRSYKFLDVLKPSLTFFGNAPSEYLAYDAWRSRNLPIVTNNQANCMVVDAGQEPMALYVTHEAYARAVNDATYYNDSVRGWYVGQIEA